MKPRPQAPGGRNLPRWLLALLLLAAIGGWYGYERQAREAFAPYGLPQAQTFGISTLHRVLRNDAFLAGYSDLMGQPLWVAYRLTPINDPKPLRRPDRFKADPRAFGWVDHNDYTGSGYDRGHLAPNYAISQLYGRAAQEQTFLMTNIAPQKPGLNQKVWQRLEEAAASRFAPHFGEVWVKVGPVFGDKPERIASGKVAVPEAFYAIFVVAGQPPQMLAFVVPQNVRGHEPLGDFVTTVDEVERLTGLDFFHRLETALQAQLEAQAQPEGWPIPAGAKNRF